MSATECVRELLDERRVEWWNQTDPEPQTVTMARLGEQLIEYHENVNGTMGYHVWNMCDLTPEQAIAATLGSCNCSNDCTNSERTDVPCLPHFWTHDGTLHIEATRMPTRIVVCEGGTCEFVPNRELDASEAENAKLRDENQSIGMAAYELGRKSMAGENAKLRELVKDFLDVPCQCLKCEHYNYEEDRCDLRDRARELGVEVD